MANKKLKTRVTMSLIDSDLIDEKAVSLIIGFVPSYPHRNFPKAVVYIKENNKRYWQRQVVYDWQAAHQTGLKLGIAWAFLRGDCTGGCHV